MISSSQDGIYILKYINLNQWVCDRFFRPLAFWPSECGFDFQHRQLYENYINWLSLSAYYGHKAVALTLWSRLYYYWIMCIERFYFLCVTGDIMANNQNETLNEMLNGINLLKIEILWKILIFFSEYASLFWKIQRPWTEQNSRLWAIFKKKKTTFWNLNEIMNETLNGLTSGKLKFC